MNGILYLGGNIPEEFMNKIHYFYTVTQKFVNDKLSEILRIIIKKFESYLLLFLGMHKAWQAMHGLGLVTFFFFFSNNV